MIYLVASLIILALFAGGVAFFCYLCPRCPRCGGHPSGMPNDEHGRPKPLATCVRCGHQWDWQAD